MKPIDVLIVGAGPAGLAAAIRLRQGLARDGREASVVVVDKAFGPGYHNLSGAAFEAACLDELTPGWRTERNQLSDHVTPVERDQMFFLTGKRAFRLPSLAVPRRMHHKGDVTISVSRLTQFLSAQADKAGAQIFHGYTARSLIVEDGAVRGVRLAEVGLDKDGRPKSNHRPAEEIRAAVTILADGTHGTLSTEFAEVFGKGYLAGVRAGVRNHPQVYSVGVKAILSFPEGSPFGDGRVVHTLGYPCPSSLFGGGFIYSLGPKTVAVGLILGLDWKWGDLNPQREFERYRAHPFVAAMLKGGTVIATGAKTIPEGGFLSVGRLSAPGALVVGDGAGFVNIEKIKGIHYAVGSGVAAADTVLEALPAGDFGEAALAGYRGRLMERGILGDLEHARNYRQAFGHGLYLGAPLSLISSWLPRLKAHPDRAATRRRARLRRPDPGGMDQATFLSLTGSTHREDEPSHVTIPDPARCLECEKKYANSCTHFCPGQVYRWATGEDELGPDGPVGSPAAETEASSGHIVLSPSNCLHCMTCAVKCPYDNIRWIPPEGGEGPRYKAM